MIFRDESRESITAYAQEGINHFKILSSNSTYKRNTHYKPGEGIVELSSGILVPEKFESPFVLYKDYRYYLFDVFVSFAELLYSNIKSPFFALAERAFTEFTITYLFFECSDNVTKQDRDKFRDLTYGSFVYYHFKKDFAPLVELLSEDVVSEIVSSKDEQALLHEIKRKMHIVANSKYNDHNKSILKTTVLNQKYKVHLHNRVHGNPFLIRETLNTEIYKGDRNIFILTSVIGQALEYLGEKESESVKSKILEFYRNLDKHLT